MKQLIYFLPIFLVIGICFTSCRSIEYVPVETIKEKVEYRDRLQRDSINVHDSVYVRANGDTILIDRWHTVYKDRILRDTSYLHKIDSVQVPYPVGKALTRWQSLKMVLGGWDFGIIILFILIIITWIVYKLRRK